MGKSIAGESHDTGMKLFLMVWLCLLAFTAAEVFLAYKQLALRLMLTLLMGASIIKATLIMSYFMHLRYERRTLVLTLIPALLFVLIMMVVMFPDSLRLYHMRSPSQ
jgi:cytochrome c oxidase subunit 4